MISQAGLAWCNTKWSIGQAAALASMLEAASPKAGNVHPTARFEDLEFAHFLVSSLALIDVFDQSNRSSVGELAESAVRATAKRQVGNTNLGTILLLAPLARATAAAGLSNSAAGEDQKINRESLHRELRKVLVGLDQIDATLVYSAIRIANPGGLGRMQQHDVRADAPSDLLSAMGQVSQLDAVARQYVTDFAEVFGQLVGWLGDALPRSGDFRSALVEVQLRWLAYDLDGLIVRKAGESVAEQARHLAREALNELTRSGSCGIAWRALDTYLRADGHRRNPGTTADLLAAAAFVMLVTCE